jgi:catechol 2,3-dioxygenase-like lactoylglutathione lyase family enzyme
MLSVHKIILTLVLILGGVVGCASGVAPTSTLTPVPFPTTAPTLTAVPLPSPTPTTPAPSSSLISATGSFFALSVADVNASSKWYQDELGLKVVLQPPKTNQSTVIVLEGGGLIVELIQNEGAVSLTQAAPQIKDKMLVYGIVKAGVVVNDFDKTVAALRAHNVTIAFGPYPASATQRANVIILDNERNLIQFFGN